MVNALIAVAAPATAFILLAAVGLDLTADDFARVRRQPAVVVAGLVLPLVILPPLAVGLTWLFQSSPNVTASVLLIAACPIGGISTTWSYLARASTALAVTLTGLSCLLASVTIPLVGAGIAGPCTIVRIVGADSIARRTGRAGAGSAGRPRHVGAPKDARIGRALWPRTPARFLHRHQRVFLLVIADDPDAFVDGLSTTVPLAAVFVVISMAAGWMTASLVTPDSADRFTLAAEFGTRNIGVAMASR
jgi:predicted Na+-dependent transporter